MRVSAKKKIEQQRAEEARKRAQKHAATEKRMAWNRKTAYDKRQAKVSQWLAHKESVTQRLKLRDEKIRQDRLAKEKRIEMKKKQQAALFKEQERRHMEKVQRIRNHERMKEEKLRKQNQD